MMRNSFENGMNQDVPESRSDEELIEDRELASENIEKEWMPEHISYSDFDLVRKETNPIKIDEEGNVVLECKGAFDLDGEEFNRITKHFTLNEVVEDVQSGLDNHSWDSAHSIYITDMEDFNEYNEKEPENILPSDTFYVGDTKLPEKSVIITSDPSIAEQIDKEKYQVIFNDEWANLSEEEKTIALNDKAKEVLELRNRKSIPRHYLNDSGHFDNETVEKAFSDFCEEHNVSCEPHVYHWTNSFEAGSPDGFGNHTEKANALPSLIRRRKRSIEQGGFSYIDSGMTMPAKYFKEYVARFDKDELVNFLEYKQLENIFEDLSPGEQGAIMDRMEETFSEEEWRKFLVDNQTVEFSSDILERIFKSIKDNPESCAIVADVYPMSEVKKSCFSRCTKEVQKELLDYLKDNIPEEYEELLKFKSY